MKVWFYGNSVKLRQSPIHGSNILIFIGKKVCLSSFFQRKIFFPTIFDSVRILVSATKLANSKIIWSKLETKEQSNKMHGWEWKILVSLKNKKISNRGPGATQALVGSSHSFLHFFFSSASISRALVVSLSWRNSMFQSLELLKEKKEEISRGVRGMPPPPPPRGKFWKLRLKSVQSEAFWRQNWRNLAH